MKLIEFIVYLQIGTTFLTLLDALTVRKKDPAVYETDWLNDWFYMSTLFINIISFLTVIILYILHKVWWETVYTREKEERVFTKLNRFLWENKECDQDFKKMTLSNRIVPLSPSFEKIKVSSPQEGAL